MSLVENKKARFDYELLETFTAGLELLGHEVKSVRGKKGSLKGAFVTVRGGEAYLVGAHIPPYQPANTPDSYDPYRNRRLLLTRKELKNLSDRESEKGLTLVPISLYNKNGVIKLDFAIGRGKKKQDKRETIKKRDLERELGRKIK